MTNLVLEQVNTAGNPTELDISAGTPSGLLVRYNGGLGIVADPNLGAGVVGFGQRGVSGFALKKAGIGVAGTGLQFGVAGDSANTDGIGVNGTSDFIGVRGIASTTFTNFMVAGVTGSTANSFGVGVNGESATFIGVRGFASGTRPSGSAGVMGIGKVRSHGVIGFADYPAFAGWFGGDVAIAGDLSCFGAKNAAVPFPDGSRRLLYSVESPESWFEDFGSARLVRGRAVVKLDRDFRHVTRGACHIFLTAEGDCSLYVARKTSRSFEVRAAGGAKVGASFSYRIVARRRDIAGKRFAHARVATLPKGADKPIAAPKAPDMPDLKQANRRAAMASKRKRNGRAKGNGRAKAA